MENNLLEKEKDSFEKKKLLSFKKNQQLNPKNQIFKIVLTGLLLGLSVVFSLIEIKIPILGATVPLRIFDSIIMSIAIPIIGVWYTLVIGIFEPWLHFAMDSDHPPVQIVFDNVANIVFIVSFVLIFYKIFKLDKIYDRKKNITKNLFATLILVPLNAIVSTLCFVLTMIVLSSTSLGHDHGDSIGAFFSNVPAIFFILLAIELARFTLIYVLFVLLQSRLAKLNH